MNEFLRFETLLQETMGLNPKSVGTATIERAVRSRCAASGARDIDAYWRQVKASSAELQELVERVIVPETWFFRDSEAFKALAGLARAYTLGGGRRLRILSLPCSTGEEPYSMAMALLDADVPPTCFHIDALDICTRSIATAHCAAYATNSFRGKDLEFRNRHFVPNGQRYAVSEAVRSRVRFRHGNLFDCGLLADEGRYDVIFCRNVLIYFGDAEQIRAVRVLSRLLDDAGTLFVGPSESGLLLRENMVSANMPRAFAFRKASPVPAPRAKSVLASPPPALQPATKALQPAITAMPGSQRTARPRAAWARPVRDQALAPSNHDPIAIATQLADQGRLREATEICQQHVKQHRPSAAAFYLLGLLSDAAGRPLEARAYYRKTLYLDPAHTEALVHLAALLEMDGDTAGARRMNERARRATPGQIN